MDLRDDAKLLKFFLEREIDEKTEENYIRHLKHYIRVAGDGLTPTELIKEAKDEEIAGIYEDYRTIEKRFTRFKAWLLEQGKQKKISNATQRYMLNSIKTFYKTLKVRWIPDTSIKAKRKKRVKLKQLPDRDEIKKALRVSNLQYQAIILLAASSGLHRGDILNLKLSEFLESFNDQTGTRFNGITDIDQLIQIANERDIILKWEKGRYKNNIEYMTFSSGEASKAILEYLRTDPHESSDDYLFRTDGRQIDEGAFNAYFIQINKRLGLENYVYDEIKKYKRITLRNLRSRFGSLLVKAGIGYQQSEFMLGHVLDATQESYYTILSEESMRLAYIKALPEFMILETLETRVLTEDRLQEIEAREEEREREREVERREHQEMLEREKEREERLQQLERQMDRRDNLDKLP